MMPSKPYFVSYREDAPEYTQLTYFGDIPEHTSFEFKTPNISLYNENYIILPLDTKIRTAKDLCNILISKRIMSSSNSITMWDVSQQRIVPAFLCSYKGPGFDLKPGKMYLIMITNEGEWFQE